METSSRAPYFILWIGCILGSLSLIPFLYFLGMLPSTMSLVTMSLLTIAKSFVFYGIVLWISYKIIPKTDLNPFAIEHPWTNIIVPGVCYGAFVSLLLATLDKTLFSASNLHSVHAPPYWAGGLASLYGAINEEVLCRVFLLSTIYYVLTKTKKNRACFYAYPPSSQRLFLGWRICRQLQNLCILRVLRPHAYSFSMQFPGLFLVGCIGLKAFSQQHLHTSPPTSSFTQSYD